MRLINEGRKVLPSYENILSSGILCNTEIYNILYKFVYNLIEINNLSK